MLARFVGASLGLLAFAVAVVTGVVVNNPVTVILSRGVLALAAFCIIGFVVGGAAQIVINEQRRNRESEILERYGREPAPGDASGQKEDSIEGEGTSVPT